MIYIIIFFILIIVVGLLVGRYLHRSYWDDMDFIGELLVIIGVGGLFMSLLVYPVSYYHNKSWIQEFKAVGRVVENNRGSIESTALKLKIAELNMELASKRYWMGTIFNDLYPAEILELEEIK